MLTKVFRVKAFVFPVVKYTRESWTIKRLNTEELMSLNCGAREDSCEPLGQRGDHTRSHFLKEVSPECSLKGLIPKLKLQYFGYLVRRADSLEKTLMLGKIEDRRRRNRQKMRRLDDITDLVDISLSKLWEMGKEREAWCAVVHAVAKVRHDRAPEQQKDLMNSNIPTE